MYMYICVHEKRPEVFIYDVSIHNYSDITYTFPCTCLKHMTLQPIYMKTDLHTQKKRPKIFKYHVSIYNDSDITYIFLYLSHKYDSATCTYDNRPIYLQKRDQICPCTMYLCITILISRIRFPVLVSYA